MPDHRDPAKWLVLLVGGFCAFSATAVWVAWLAGH